MGSSWVGFDPNNTAMFRQRQDHPTTEMMVNRDEGSFLLNSPLENQRIIGPRLASFLRANDIMPCIAQRRGQFNPKHLIQLKTHSGLRHTEGGDLRVQNGTPGVLQGSVDIIPRQCRVAAQQ
jgi:hypothetical protein